MNAWQKVLLGLVIAAIVVVVVVVAMREGTEAKGLRIGAVLPLTGDIASYGKRAQKGIELALEHLQSPGGGAITVEFQDGKGDAKESVTLMNKFCSIDKVPVVIGAAASSVSLAMVPVANRNRVVQISPISSSPELTEKGGDYFFRVCPSDAFQAVILAKWMSEMGVKSVGILYVNNSWGGSLKDRFVAEFKALGGTIATEEACLEGDRDFRTQLTRVVSLKPDAIYSPTYGKEGGLILKQLRELGWTGKVFGSDVWSSPELLASAGKAAEGVYLVKPMDPSGAKWDAFRETFKAKYGEEPDVYAAYAYDIVMILAEAVKADARTGPEIREFLLKMPPHEGVTGATQFDAKGDCNTKPFARMSITQGKYAQVP
jgi:branched-chain amino acid transport system substrate-binding protein